MTTKCATIESYTPASPAKQKKLPQPMHGTARSEVRQAVDSSPAPTCHGVVTGVHALRRGGCANARILGSPTSPDPHQRRLCDGGSLPKAVPLGASRLPQVRTKRDQCIEAAETPEDVLPDHKIIHGTMCFYVPRQLLHVITLTWHLLMDLTHYHAARTPRSLPALAMRHDYLNALL